MLGRVHTRTEPAGAWPRRRAERPTRARSISLVARGGEHMLFYPVLEAGVVPPGPLVAAAKCQEGTAAWHAFRSGETLLSQRLPAGCARAAPPAVMLHASAARRCLPGGSALMHSTSLPLHACPGSLPSRWRPAHRVQPVMIIRYLASRPCSRGSRRPGSAKE